MWIMQAHPATGAAVGGHGAHLEDPQCGRGATQPGLHEAFPTPSPGGEPHPPDFGQTCQLIQYKINKAAHVHVT